MRKSRWSRVMVTLLGLPQYPIEVNLQRSGFGSLGEEADEVHVQMMVYAVWKALHPDPRNMGNPVWIGEGEKARIVMGSAVKEIWGEVAK